jgi:L-lysine exporter family protein LysE/ArgO
MGGGFVSGFALGYSLILAIGAQNAFVLRQGLRREHVFAVCLTCAVSDAVLIAAGVAGFGALVRAAPWVEPLMRYGGAAFLIVYGALSLRRAFSETETLAAASGGPSRLGPVLLAVLGFTWLNPHVYLDTLVMVGSISSQYDNRLAFGLGATAASFTFFFGLGYGARLLAPLFGRPGAWRTLEFASGLVMWVLALNLISSTALP